MIIGAQLYTVRNACQTPEGLAETLRRVADMGYTTVQLSGTCDYDGDWMREQLDRTGLSAPITHYKYERIVNETDATIALHDKIGAKYIGLGGMPGLWNPAFSQSMYEDFMTAILPAAKKIAAAGHKFMYHNHNREFMRFDDGRTMFEHLLERTDPADFGITMDFYWVQMAGADPMAWARRCAGRIDCVHFKDMSFSLADGATRMAAVGDGNMNLDGILAACEDAGAKYFFVEQDNCYDDDPFDCLRRSYLCLRAHGLQ